MSKNNNYYFCGGIPSSSSVKPCLSHVHVLLASLPGYERHSDTLTTRASLSSISEIHVRQQSAEATTTVFAVIISIIAAI